MAENLKRPSPSDTLQESRQNVTRSSHAPPLLIDQKRHGCPNDGVCKLVCAHRIALRLAVTNLPVHVRLVEEASVRHDAGSHATLAQPLDLDQAGWLAVGIPDAAECDDVEGGVILQAPRLHGLTVPHPPGTRSDLRMHQASE